MFEYIKGILADITPATAVIEVAGIGYNIQISLNCYTNIRDSKEKEIKLFIHQVLREDANILFGFIDHYERQVFQHLITVSGIGANTARMMLSSLSAGDIQKAIVSNDVQLLKTVKGVGLKTAQRIILDLKDKLQKQSDTSDLIAEKDNTFKEQALSALIELGFQRKQIEKAIQGILRSKQTEIQTVEQLVKAVLNKL